MALLPTGTVTFLFTDIESSTSLLQQLGDVRYAQLLADHRRLLRAAFEAHGGHEVESTGDGFLIAFQTARDAVLAAVDAQRTVAAHPWPPGILVRVRMSLHTGEALRRDSGYVGLDVHRAARICEAGWGGQILLSWTTGSFVERNLPDGVSLRDLGEHRLKSLERPERIYQILHPELPGSFPPLRSLTTLSNNLPQQLTSFVGREREMTEVKRLLSGTRLLTLSGPGGSGKTRLAVQVAADVGEEYRDGVWFVELAPLSDPAHVAPAVASALGLREEPARQLLGGQEQTGRTFEDALLSYLQRKQLLLVLDNCEHVVSACALLVAALLRACPDLRILATSQEALGIPGEVLWAVPPLSPPDPARLPPLRDLSLYPAVQLFMDRAAAAVRDFSLTLENAHAVAQVVHRLDGIPLAIELAASRVRVLSVEQIAARLDDRFRLLTGGSRISVPRHQTLRATMDWSYGLLTDAEQALLRRLSVFVGGWTLEDAEAVCADDEVEATAILDLLARLVDKSLVLVDERSDGARYRLLETVRQYSQEWLVESGENVGVRDRHRDWYVQLAERAEPELHGPTQAAWLQRLATEHDNLRAALKWSLERQHAEAGLRLASALWWFWYVYGFFVEGRRWAEQALAGSAHTPTHLRAKVMQRAGLLCWAQGDYTAAVEFCDQSLALAREAGDDLTVVYALITLGMVAHRNREYTHAAAQYEEALAISRRLGDRWSTSVILIFLGRVLSHLKDHRRAESLLQEGLALSRALGDRWGLASHLYQSGQAAWREDDTGRARALFEESLARFRELGSKEGMQYALNMLGRVAFAQGAYDRAEASHEESLALSREMGDKPGTAYALYHAALAAYRQGAHEKAAAMLLEGLALRRELVDRRGMTECLDGLALVAWARGRQIEAARLLGAADSLRGTSGIVAQADRGIEAPDLAALRERLEGAQSDAWAEGRAMTPEQAVAYATGNGVA